MINTNGNGKFGGTLGELPNEQKEEEIKVEEKLEIKKEQEEIKKVLEQKLGKIAKDWGDLLNKEGQVEINLENIKVESSQSFTKLKNLQKTLEGKGLADRVVVLEPKKNSPCFIIGEKESGTVIADLMMGGDGTYLPEELNEFYLGALAEFLKYGLDVGFKDDHKEIKIIDPKEKGLNLKILKSKEVLVVESTLRIPDLSEGKFLLLFDLEEDEIKDKIKKLKEPTTSPEKTEEKQQELKVGDEVQWGDTIEKITKIMKDPKTEEKFAILDSDPNTGIPLKLLTLYKKPVEEIPEISEGAIEEIEKQIKDIKDIIETNKEKLEELEKLKEELEKSTTTPIEEIEETEKIPEGTIDEINEKIKIYIKLLKEKEEIKIEKTPILTNEMTNIKKRIKELAIKKATLEIKDIFKK